MIGLVPWWALPVAGGILGATIIFLWLTFRCRHAWELVDKTEFKSGYELLTPGTGFWRDQLPMLLKRTVVLVIRCPKCGAAKVLREESA